MELIGALRKIPRRLARPTIWGTVLGLFLVFMVIFFFTPERASFTTFGEVMLSLRLLISLALLLGLSPLAWQWGALEGRLAKTPRALGQVFLLQGFNGLTQWLLGNEHPLGNPKWGPIGTLVFWGMNALLYLCIGLVIARRELLRDLAAQAEHHAREAQSAQLRAQLSPHALLNALNGLAGLVREDAQKAARGMRDLAELYRLLLHLGSSPSIHMGEERDLLNHYLSVESMRLEDTLQVQWDWDPGVDERLVPPLLVQTLVENAIKHGIAPCPEGGHLRIEAHPFGDGLLIQVSNTGLPLAPDSKSSGLGLSNLKARLALAYGARATFELRRDEAWTQARLVIPGGP